MCLTQFVYTNFSCFYIYYILYTCTLYVRDWICVTVLNVIFFIPCIFHVYTFYIHTSVKIMAWMFCVWKWLNVIQNCGLYLFIFILQMHMKKQLFFSNWQWIWLFFCRNEFKRNKVNLLLILLTCSEIIWYIGLNLLFLFCLYV